MIKSHYLQLRFVFVIFGFLAIFPTQSQANLLDHLIPDQVDQIFESADYYGFKTGYIHANLKTENMANMSMIPLFYEVGWSMNELLGLADHSGEIYFVLESFVATVTDPDYEFAAGSGIFIKYLHPLTDQLSVHLGFGAIPMYLGLDTYEQGTGGFEFLDSGGGGLEYSLNDTSSINLNYRFFHISNFGLRDPNGGINGHAVFLGLVNKY